MEPCVGRTSDRTSVHRLQVDLRLRGSNMEVHDLFSANMEPAFSEWVGQFRSPTDLLSASPQLYSKLESQVVEGTIEDGAQIVGPVFIAAGAVVQSLAIIRGPAIVGRNAVVGSHTEIRSGCFIGSQCSIGHGCSLATSIVMNNAVIRSAAVITNSVIGFQSIVGSGAVLGDAGSESLRYDACNPIGFGVFLGDNSTVGANCILKPGTIVGQRTIIGEGLLAHGTYDCDQRLSIIQNVEVSRRQF
jgi:NDP-sugar pyrophosphorylase family protein